MKRALTMAAAAIGLCFITQGASAETKAPVSNPNSTFTLVKYGGHGGYHGGYHGGGHMGHFRGGRAFHGHGFHGRGFAFRGHRFHHRHHGFFFGPFIDFGVGGSCYWNCRQFHGPRYCRYYALDYCY